MSLERSRKTQSVSEGAERARAPIKKSPFRKNLAIFFAYLHNLLYLCSQKLQRHDMSKYEIPFLTSAIQAFASKFAMTRQAAFRYLQQYKALAFLMEFYDVEHLQSMDDTIDDMLIVCRKNGGTLA